ncbi:MAG: tetratricopeptide repeat protein [Planctomycetota bacterium]
MFYKGQKSKLETHWAYPSPLQLYYLTNKEEKYPFIASNTANWRGHIATWEIKNGAFSLLSVWREYYISEKGRVQREEGQLPLEKLFGGKVKDGKVKADWFNGYFLVLSRPYKEWHDSPYSDDKFYTIQHETTVIVEVKEGEVVSEHAYKGKEFFNNYARYLKKEEMNEKDKEVFSKYFDYIKSFRQLSDQEKKPKKVYSEKDFTVFLKRFKKNEKDKFVSIPLTDFCLIRDATYKDTKRAYLINSEIIPSENMNLLKFEMGASNVPEGQWSPYVSGAVRLVTKIGKLMPCTIDLGAIADEIVIHNNTYARYKSPKSVSGIVKIESVNESRIIMSGNITFKSRNPSTLQEIQLSNSMIPIYTIQEYLDLHKKRDAAYVMLRQKKYEELMNAQNTKTDKEPIQERVEEHVTKSNFAFRVDVNDLFFLADIYADEGNDDEAIRHYEKGLQVDSRRPDYQLKLEKLLKKRDDKVKAAEKGKIIFRNAEEERVLRNTEKILRELGE